MGRVLTDERHYAAIAAALRHRLETETRYRPGEMAAAVESILGRSPHADVLCSYTLDALPMAWESTAAEKEE